ncbi:MAG TPA: aminopeptidase P family protein [Rhodothermales bacterium]|nr:aminopeptidase P family protein [Rhodothermales bacterium]
MSVERLQSIRSLIKGTGDEALLLTAREDVRWACGFSGSSGAVLICETEATLFTDSRYAEQAPLEVDGTTVEIYSGDLLAAVGRHPTASSLSSIAVDGGRMSVAEFRRVQSWPNEPQVRSYDFLLSPLTAVKSDDEIRRMRRAQEISDGVFEEILSLIEPGVSERELAAEIVYRHLKRGAEAMSFEPIVASGPNGALPHAQPTDRRFANGDLVVLDFGCFVEGYASDMTRTVGLGRPESDALEAYSAVRRAQEAAQGAARSGIKACDLDGIARGLIEEAGLGGAFSHGLGHGLGLRLHESPRLAAANDEILPDRAVVTIEPGVYIPGRFGVRIENAVILRPGDCIALPQSPTNLILL